MRLEKDFEDFRADAAWCRIVFNTHQVLFDGGDEIDRLLRETAGWFFHDYSVISQEYHHLLVARLTDPASSGPNANLTVSYLVDRLQSHGLLTEEIQQLANNILGYRERIVASRNKQIAHRDLRTVQNGKKAETWPKQEVEQFHRNLNLFCDEVGKALGLGPLDFASSAVQGDAVDLIRVLHSVKSK